MREIKFRGHDGCDWLYSKSIDYCELDDMYYMLTGEICDGEDAWTGVCYIGQYTGLKDKNGKEIYEGDILLSKDIDGCKYITEVTYENGMFLSGEEILYDDVDLFEAEVIGNIYDNPSEEI